MPGALSGFRPRIIAIIFSYSTFFRISISREYYAVVILSSLVTARGGNNIFQRRAFFYLNNSALIFSL